MATWINPFDWQTIFVGTLAGSWQIFIFIILIAISFLAGRFRLPDKIFLIFIVLFAIILGLAQLGGLYILIMLITGLVIYYGLAKLVKQ